MTPDKVEEMARELELKFNSYRDDWSLMATHVLTLLEKERQDCADNLCGKSYDQVEAWINANRRRTPTQDGLTEGGGTRE